MRDILPATIQTMSVTETRVLAESGSFDALDISPDGKKAAVTVRDRANGLTDIWVYDLSRGVRDRLTSDFGVETSPAWSPDGKLIACVALGYELEKRYVSLVEVKVDDGSERVIASRKWEDIIYLAWLSDGTGLVITARDDALRLFQIWQVARESGEAALRELLRVRQLRRHLAFCERRLARLGPSQEVGQDCATQTSPIPLGACSRGMIAGVSSMPSGRSRSRRSPADTACPPLNWCGPARSSRFRCLREGTGSRRRPANRCLVDQNSRRSRSPSGRHVDRWLD